MVDMGDLTVFLMQISNKIWVIETRPGLQQVCMGSIAVQAVYEAMQI